MAKIRGKLTLSTQELDTHLLLFQQIYAFHQATEVALKQFQLNKSYMDVLRLIRSRFFTDSSYARESVNQAWQLFLRRQEIPTHFYAMVPTVPSTLWNRKNMVLAYIPHANMFYLTVQLGYYHAEIPEIKGIPVQFNENMSRQLLAYLQHQPQGNYLSIKQMGLVAIGEHIYLDIEMPIQSKKVAQKVSLAASFLAAVVALQTTTPTLAMAEDMADSFQLAQTAKMMKIVDKTTGQAIAGVEIRSEENNKVLASSGADGSFAITPEITNTLFISVVKAGYKMQLLDTADLDKMGLTIQLESLMTNTVKPEASAKPNTNPVASATPTPSPSASASAAPSAKPSSSSNPSDLNELLEKELSDRENKNGTNPVTKPVVPPSASPTAKPTMAPTASPTAKPTMAPTAKPTAKPTMAPTAKPTAKPTMAPTAKPTAKPTMAPTAKPTAKPITKPTQVASKPAPAKQNPAPMKAQHGKYVVQPGDSLVKIAETQLGHSKHWYKLYLANSYKIGAGYVIYPGQTLQLPMVGSHMAAKPNMNKTRDYVVQPGDSLSKIAMHYFGHYGHWKTIYEMNKGRIKDPTMIYIGQVIKIPG